MMRLKRVHVKRELLERRSSHFRHARITSNLNRYRAGAFPVIP